MFNSHPSCILNSLFKHKPYQGVDPSDAEFLFIGLDANYHPDIEQKAIFPRIHEYHDDGVLFWKKNGVHHPFLLPEYDGDGQLYHRNFAKIGFRPDHADKVSFIELLHVPTIGRSKLVAEDLDDQHLRKLNDIIVNGKPKHIFVPNGVAQIMMKTKKFDLMPKKPVEKFGSLKVWYRNQEKVVYKYLHFSNYGKFQKQMEREAETIRRLI